MKKIIISTYIILIAILIISCNKNTSEEKSIDLSQSWKFSPDEKNKGLSKKWHTSQFDDSKWDDIDVSKRWEIQGYKGLKGFAWYRNRVEVPSNWKGENIWIKFSGIGSTYQLYINGKKVSHSNEEMNSVARIPTFSEVSSLLNYGEVNQISVQVNGKEKSGGIRRVPIILTTDESEINNILGSMSKTVNTAESLGYELFWEDNFNGDKLDNSKWEVRQPGPRGAGYIDARAVNVKDGNLELSTFIVNDSVLTGMVGTENRLMTKYGYFECRAELNKSWGPVPAFWIQSTEIREGEDPGKYGVEIDIFEYFKRWGLNVVSHNIHWAYGPNMHSSPSMESKLEGLEDGFHTFGLEWTPEKYTFFVDGYKYYEIDYAISHIDEYVILSLLLPGTIEELKETVFPDTYKIDYVKIYKKKTD